MTNGRGAGMASFMTKKKKYKFQVEICLEELLEVPFVSAVLFAKLRLLEGGNFQDHSTREEVRAHKVKWDSKFAFPCKMMANASTGVMEKCNLRISVRKEQKGGRSYSKLGFVDINLAEYAGAGVTHRKALLEGYDTRHRQDNSMLKFSLTLNMLSGDILFKAPSPSLKHKQIASSEDAGNETRTEEFSSGSLAGSIASGSSGFGSLTKKRTPLLQSDLVIGQTLAENNVPTTVAFEINNEIIQAAPVEQEDIPLEQGHSRNSSNTSQLSKASGYSSVHSHSHSRQSSSGDSGHIREPQPKPFRNLTNVSSLPSKFSKAKRIHIPTTTQEESFGTPQGVLTPSLNGFKDSNSVYYTPKALLTQTSVLSTSSNDEYRTPENSFIPKPDLLNLFELQKSLSTGAFVHKECGNRISLDEKAELVPDNVLRSKSEFQIPRNVSPNSIEKESFFNRKFFKSDSLFSFLTPSPKRKVLGVQSTPNSLTVNLFKVPASPIPNHNPRDKGRTSSLNSLRCGASGSDGQRLGVQCVQRSLPHRKLLEGTSGGKLAPLAISPDETPSSTVSSDNSQNPTARRPSVTTNPSSSSLVLSETGSLERAKASFERRKKAQVPENETESVQGRVETTRVNPNDLIEELLKDTNLEQPDDSAESSGLQLFIAKDGTAALGNHEVKSQMSTGVQVFKQVVMDNRCGCCRCCSPVGYITRSCSIVACNTAQGCVSG